MGIEEIFGPRKYKIGDKISFTKDFKTHEYEITSQKGANAVNKYRPKTHDEFKSFTRIKRR